MWIGVISLFPEMFKAITEFGVTGRAVKHNLLQVECWNPRDFTFDKYKTVDDRPYGGGPGMLMMVQPLRDAIHAAKAAAGEGAKVIYLSPQGRKLDQGGVTELAQNQKLILVCGRYEGIDERLIQTEIDEEWSIGDYVLTGGELPAMTLIDAVARFIPGIRQTSLRRRGFFCRWFIRLSALHQTGSIRRINCTARADVGTSRRNSEMAIKTIATKNVAPTP